MKSFIFLILCFFSTPLLQGASSGIERANEKYRDAERTAEVKERNILFNQALALYLAEEPKSPSEKFCYNIANTYFQLGEYGYAILYYYKALQISPRDERILYNLRVAEEKAGIASNAPSLVTHYLFYFHSGLSHNEKVTLCLAFFVLIFSLYSLHIWSKQPLPAYKKSAAFFLILALLFLSSIVWSEYFVTPVGIIVQPTSLRVDKGAEYAIVANSQIIPGVKVDVIEYEPTSGWLRVRLPSGQEGFVAKKYIRLV
jgi:tetratricopeptide (TPR) repeat protein